MIEFLKGKKTYIVATVAALLNLAVVFGWLTPDNLTSINMVLVALGFGAVRAGIANNQ